jgi:hypothetical protein
MFEEGISVMLTCGGEEQAYVGIILFAVIGFGIVLAMWVLLQETSGWQSGLRTVRGIGTGRLFCETCCRSEVIDETGYCLDCSRIVCFWDGLIRLCYEYGA